MEGFSEKGLSGLGHNSASGNVPEESARNQSWTFWAEEQFREVSVKTSPKVTHLNLSPSFGLLDLAALQGLPLFSEGFPFILERLPSLCKRPEQINRTTNHNKQMQICLTQTKGGPHICGTHGSFLIRHRCGHPGVVLPLVFLIRQSIRKECN